ncbi:MAG: hypothetical protein R3F30_13810 [Planctomycetota bacterium]
MVALPTFTSKDFAAYAPGRQRDPEYNPFRLAVRRKLGTWAKALARALKDEGLDLAARTSLERPYRFNAGRVDAQWAYLSRRPADKKALTARVGPALGKDVDTHYIQTTLVLAIDDEGLEQALRVHALAWWDGLNVANACREPEGLQALCDLLNALPEGFVLLMDTWKKEYVCGRLHPSDLRAYFARYSPGEHWLNLRRRLPAAAVEELGDDLATWVLDGARALAPVYRFIVWTPENDRLFDEDGRIRRP